MFVLRVLFAPETTTTAAARLLGLYVYPQELIHLTVLPTLTYEIVGKTLTAVIQLSRRKGPHVFTKRGPPS